MSRTSSAIVAKLLAGLALVTPLAGAAGAEEDAPLFASHETLAVTLEAPLKRLARDRKGDPEYFEAVLALTGDEATRLDLKIRTRGKFRRQSRICRFPPIRLNFRKKQTEGTIFDGQDKLKLVTHCRDNDEYTQYLLKEYLAYRILNRITDASFRVRLLDIRYVDSERPDRTERHYGFVIEDDDALGRRIGAESVEIEEAPRVSLDPVHTAHMTMYQYLIGNTDWSFIKGPEGHGCCHNSVPFRLPDGRYLPVPYDFDFSGFVDPPYADPPEQFRLKNVRERYYRGPCESETLMAETISYFQAAEPDILGLIREQEGLDEKVRRETLDYVADFYATLADPAAVRREFFGRCSED